MAVRREFTLFFVLMILADDTAHKLNQTGQMKLDRQEAGSGGFLQYYSILRQRNPAGAHTLYIPPAQRILHIPTTKNGSLTKDRTNQTHPTS